jgi:hypothetical protein
VMPGKKKSGGMINSPMTEVHFRGACHKILNLRNFLPF